MLIARQKRKENIVEYILYMWQLEDLLRANQFDMERIRQNIVDKFDSKNGEREEIARWYENLLLMMERENIKEKGHLQINRNQVNDLYEFHLLVMKSGQLPQYDMLFRQAKPFIDEFSAKAGGAGENDIETSLNALYGVLLLKLKGEDVSPGTLASVKMFSQFLAHLAQYYKQYESGKLEL